MKTGQGFRSNPQVGNKSPKKQLPRYGLLAMLCSASFLALSPTEATAQARQAFDIPPQTLSSALNQYVRQTRADLLFSADDLAGARTSGVRGTYSTRSALTELLEGTGFRAVFGGDGTISLRPASSGRAAPASRGPSSEATRANRVQYASAGQASASASSQSAAVAGQDENAPVLQRAALEDEGELEPLIVVTGTNIRGVAPVGSPLETYTREEIMATGRATVQDFIQTLPENFGGGVSEGTFGIAPSGNTNINGGTGVNLRGLGNDSTLVLLNGRRLAPAGLGTFIDISMIPLTAIERVDVLTDGASAIYGSDAVGGVVNFNLREDYDGAETRLRYGTATSGDLDEIQIGQTFGRAWGTGNALISYEYYRRDSLDANDRDFTRDAPDPQDLLPQQERHSIFLSARQQLGETLTVFGDGFYSRREADTLGTRSNGEEIIRGQLTDQLGASLGGRLELSERWQAELVGTYSRTEVTGVLTTVETNLSADTDTGIFTTWTFDANADGPLFRLPGGDVRLAFGGHYRHERRSGISVGTGQTLADRDVHAVFGEINIPIVSEQNSRPGIQRLEVTAAGRYEEYSDFGSSVDPKVGALWSPFNGLDLRGTFGTSFRAPLFEELDVVNTANAVLITIPDPLSPTGTALSAIGIGGNPDLGPETATTWTAGFDFQFPPIPELRISATYFDIDFTDRIGRVFGVFDALTNPRFAPIIDRNPDPALLAFFQSLPLALNLAPGFEFTDAEVLVDGRNRNLSSVRTRGLDFNVSYDLDSDIGTFGFRLGGTYLFEQSEQIISTDEPVDVIDTVFNPPDFRARGSLSWNHNGISSNFAINYVDGYRNELIVPAALVDSWTTVDLYISYNTGRRSTSWLQNTTFSFSVLNLFDNDPPFVENPLRTAEFDPTNADARGRTIAFQITKQW